MPEPGRQWSCQELHDLSQRRKDLYPDHLVFREGGWWYSRDMAVGSIQVQEIMLERANRLMRLKERPFADLDLAIQELDRIHPWKWGVNWGPDSD